MARPCLSDAPGEANAEREIGKSGLLHKWSQMAEHKDWSIYSTFRSSVEFCGSAMNVIPRESCAWGLRFVSSLLGERIKVIFCCEPAGAAYA